MLTSHKDLVVWQKSMDLVSKIYLKLNQLPTSEKFNLTAQIQRSEVSVPSNIAEGYNRNNRKEYVHFLGVAKGSAAELETQLIIASEVYKVDFEDELTTLSEVQKILAVLQKSLKNLPQPLNSKP